MKDSDNTNANPMKASKSGLVAFLSALAGGFVVWVAQGHTIRLIAEGLTYAELAALLLGVASIMVAVLGIGVAFLAFWGFKHFKQVAIEEARRTVASDLGEGRSKELIEEVARFTAAKKVEYELTRGESRKVIENEISRAIAVALTNNGLAGAELANSRREEKSRYPELEEEVDNDN